MTDRDIKLYGKSGHAAPFAEGAGAGWTAEVGMSLGPNGYLIGRNPVEGELATPALLLDLDLFEANLQTMQDLTSRAGKKLRPHAKAHKSPAVGWRQMEAGAVGLCCATVLEAEVMADAGIDGILVTTPVVTAGMVARLAQARSKIADLAVVVESDLGVDRLAAAARADQPIGVLIDIDMGFGRTGVTAPDEAVRLARRIADEPRLAYRGIQAYYGHLQHVPLLADRLAKVSEQWRRLAGFLATLEAAGLAPAIVSGGGTGTHHLDLEQGPFTEIQAGSYPFMDKQYGAVELAPGGSPFRTALTVAARVVSTVQADRVIVDAGSKALSTDAGPALVAAGAPPGSVYQFMGDEHGALRLADGVAQPELGSLVKLVAPHCDPTVNLHDRFHVMRGGMLVDIWPIAARGY